MQMKEVLQEVEKTLNVVSNIADKLMATERLVKALEERVANVEEVLSKGVSARARIEVEGKTAQEKFENFLLMRATDEQIAKWQDLSDAYTVFASIRRLRHLPTEGWLERRFVEVTKAVTGSDLVNYIPTTFSNRVLQLIRLQPSLAQLLPQVDMPSQTYKIPLSISGISVVYVAPATAITLSNASAQGLTLDAKKLAAGVEVADEVTEDSIVAIMPEFQAALAQAFAEALENAILNGDTSSTDPLLKVWNGILKDAHSLDIGTFAAQHIQQACALMGKLGVNPNEVVVVVNPAKFAEMVGWDEVSTVDKYGAQATIVTGELAKIYGKPVVVSAFVPEGVHALVFNRRAFLLGVRRGLRVETQRDIVKQTDILVTTMRADFIGVPYEEHKAVKIV
jgi:HK97 family phage major capsid protein